MSDIKWTKEQERVIYGRGKNMLVSASAGSGKTTVMIRRITELIEEGASLADMVICTFTKASAADMRAKLYERITERAKEGGEARERFRRELSLLPQAQISTIHSFCQQLIKTYFYAVDIDPDFEIIDDRKASAMLSSCIESLIDERLLRGEEDFLALYDVMLKNRNASRLSKLIKEVYEFAECQESFEGWLDGCLDSSYRHEEHKQYLIARGLEENCADPKDVLSYSRVIVSLIRDVAAKYSAEKRKKAYADYSDLERLAIEILSNGNTRAAANAKYKYIFVDEYQDVNPLQEKLISYLTGQKFFVGDVKQSIYAFRMCDSRIFLGKYAKYKAGDGGEAVELNANFRSRREILDFCNEVFGRIMTEDFGKVDYERNARFVTRPDEERGDGKKCVSARIVFVPKTEKKELSPRIYSVKAHENDVGEIKGNDAETTLVARRIEELLSVKDGNGKKVNEPSDIVVLLRAVKGDYSALLKKKLIRKNIPVFVSDSRKADENPDVNTLLSALRYIDNRCDDVSLCAVMRSYLGGFTDDDIAAIREWDNARAKDGGKERFFYEAVRDFCAAAESGDYKEDYKESAPILKILEKLKRFDAKFERYALLSKTVSVSRLLGVICSENEYFEYVYSKTGGEVCAKELALFLDFAESDTLSGSLGAFLKNIEREMPTLEAPPPTDAVRIMTVHASKGLEFKHVILGDIGKKFNKRDLYKTALTDTELGLSLKSFNTEEGTEDGTSLHLRMKAEKDIALKEEEMRILYVALTRAKETLAVFGSVKKEPEPVEVERAERYIDWLYPHIKDFAVWTNADECADSEESAAADGSLSGGGGYDAELKEAIKDYIAAPQKREKKYPRKTTVTSAARADSDESDAEAEAAFADNERGAEIGSAYHLIMQELDFYAPFKSEWERLGRDFPDECAVVNKSSIEKAQGIMARLCDGKKVYRELPFLAPFDANEIYSDAGGEIMVQGIIDLLVKDGDGFIIADYKSGSVTGEHFEAYRKQVSIYSLAVEKLLGGKVKKKFLYSFSEAALTEI